MLRSSCIFIAAAALLLGVCDVSAAPANECVVNGAVTYQQGPCPSSETRTPPTLQELNAAEKKKRAAAASTSPDKLVPAALAVPGGMSCDGRKHCSQMKSCAEAKYFLANCAGVKMDGDKNGIPCEQQWCAR